MIVVHVFLVELLLGLLDDVHLAAQVVSLDVVIPLDHVVSALDVNTIGRALLLAEQAETLGAAQAAPDSEGALLRVVVSLGVARDAQRAALTSSALTLGLVLAAIHDVVVAGCAEVVAALAANKETD